MSRKRANSRTRGRKRHSTEAKARGGRTRKTRADLEQQLKACRREIAQARERLAEATLQQTATSEMLRLISNSPIQSVLDAVAEHAARLCGASNARIRRLEDNLVRLVASYGESSATMDGREGLPINRDTVTGRAACDRRTIHVHDIAAEDSEYPLGSRVVKGQGWRTTLATPLLREGTPIGTILVRRMEVRPFSDKQIALLETFANQAAIAIENVRLFEAEKQRALALEQSEYKLRQIIETLPSLIWATTPDGEPSQLNQRVLDYSDMRFEDFLNGGWAKIIHSDDLAETAKALNHAIQTETSYETVHRLRRADGEYRWHHALGEPLRDENGRIIQWYGLSVDIEERKKAEDRLRRSEAYLTEAQRLSHTGTSVFNKTTVLYWSEETYRMWGFDPLQGVPSREAVRQRMHPDDWERVEENIERGVREKKSVANEFRIILPDGTVKHVQATNHPVFSASGELLEIIGTGIDVTERKRAEQVLREREAKIRRLVDSNIIGIFIWDFDGRILEANEAFLHIVGYDHEDLVAGRIRWTDLTPPEWRDRDTRLMQEHEVTGSLQPFEKEYFQKDGSRVPVLIGVATFEEGGNQGVAFVLDLTERKRAEERLRVQHTVAQILAEAATIEEATPRILLAMGECLGWDVGVLWRVDREAEALRCVELWHKASIEVPEFERVSRQFTFGRGLGLPGRVWTSLEPEYIPDVVLDENFPRAPIAEREGLRAAFGFPILLGKEVFGVVEFFSREIKQPDQELLNVLATIGSQIGQFSERKRAEESLRRGEAWLAQAQRLSHTGTWVMNGTTRRFLYWSDESYRIWGLDPLQGLPSREDMWGRIHPDDRERVWGEVQEAMRDQRDFFAEFRILLPDGTVKYLEANTRHVFSPLGALLEVLCTIVDVTERKRTQGERERLRQLESDLAHMNRVSMMGELAASLSHEIAQPIATARNNARAAQNFLDRQPPDLGEIREALNCVVGDTDRAGDIVDRIRDHIKKTPPRKEHFDLNEAVNEVIALGRSAIIKNGVSVQTRLSEGLFPIHCDRVQLQQVVLNLILNAAEAMGSVEAEPRDLLISTAQHHTGVLVAVRDSGPGIDPTHLERVFEAFYTTKSRGVGMGLSICRSIIGAHGGRLWAEANEPRGAVFLFTLPSADDKFMVHDR